MDIKIKPFVIEKIPIQGPNIHTYPYSVDHNVSPFDPEWRHMVSWTLENIGPRFDFWMWSISSKWHFVNHDDAVKFALTWSQSG